MFKYITRPKSNQNSRKNSPTMQTSIIPRDGKLFIHKYNDKFFCCGSGFSYQFDPETFDNIERRFQPQTEQYQKPFNHFHQAVQLGKNYFCICMQGLWKLQGHTMEKIAQLPFQCNEKYKIFVKDSQIYVLDDKGAVYVYKDGQLHMQDTFQYQGDCYATSHCGKAVLLSNAQHTIYLYGNDEIHVKLDKYMTVDFLNAYVCICHNDDHNTLIDFTTVYLNKNGRPTTYDTGKRVRDLEWNKLSQNLRIFDDFLLPETNYLQMFMNFDVGEFTNRLQSLIFQQSPSPQNSQKFSLSTNTPAISAKQALDGQGLQLEVENLQNNVFSRSKSLQRNDFNNFQGDIQQQGLNFNQQQLQIKQQEDIRPYKLLVMKQQDQIKALQYDIANLKRQQMLQQQITHKIIQKVGQQGYDDLLDQIIQEYLS